MMLWREFLEPCVMLVPTRTEDDEGGFATEWENGGQFEAAVVLDTSNSAIEAERIGLARSYIVTSVEPLDFHDVFMRASGQVLRVVGKSSDKSTPAHATFAFSQVRAEDWSLDE